MPAPKLPALLSRVNIYLLRSFDALKVNRFRTLLSILGVTVGIAAVTVVASISRGGRAYVYAELETLGLKSVWVYRDYEDKDPHRGMRAGTGIDNYDYEEVRNGCCPALRRVTPIIYGIGGRMLLQAGSRYSNTFNMIGVGVDYLPINNDVVSRGRFFREEEIVRNRSVVIIGTEIQDDLFGKQRSPIGQDIRIGDNKFTVIGVLKAKSRDFLASIGSGGGQNANKRVLMPYTSYQQLLGSGKKDIAVLQGESVDIGSAELATTQLKYLLKRRHGHDFSYKSETMAQYVRTANNILNGVAVMGIIAASVSLVVGGIGIMNVMSTSVVERTREIGLKKALGAPDNAILIQFLLEASIISSFGGIIGLLMGAAFGALLAMATGIPLIPSWEMATIAVLVSMAVGLLSGYYPARRAARMRPVEALRHE